MEFQLRAYMTDKRTDVHVLAQPVCRSPLLLSEISATSPLALLTTMTTRVVHYHGAPRRAAGNVLLLSFHF